MRAGRSVRSAIHTGYTKGFATIVDANVVTTITALVLFAVATASVRGFALMLLVGTAMSMLTAVLATRAFLAVLAGFKMLDSPSCMGAAGGGIPRWLKLDYIGRRNTWFAISGTVILISLGAIAVKGLNFGIDFQGGTQVAVRDAEARARSSRCARRRRTSARRARRSRDGGAPPGPRVTPIEASRSGRSR